MQITTSTFLEKPVSPGGTFSAAWKPALADASINKDGHVAVSRGGSEYNGLSVVAGNGALTITNNSALTMPAGGYIVGIEVQDRAGSTFLAAGRSAALVETLERYGATVFTDGDAVRANVELTRANYKAALRNILALYGPSDLVRVILPPGDVSIPGLNISPEIYDLSSTEPPWALSTVSADLPAFSGTSIDLVNAPFNVDLGVTVASKAGGSLVLNWNSATWPSWLRAQKCAIPGLGRVTSFNAGANTVTLSVPSKLPAPTANEPILSYFERVNPVFYSVIPLIGTRLVSETGSEEIGIANTRIQELHRVIVENLGMFQSDIGSVDGSAQTPSQCYFSTLTVACGSRVRFDASHIESQFAATYGSNLHIDSAFFGGEVLVSSYSTMSAWLSSFYGNTAVEVKGCATLDIQNSYVQTAATAISTQAGCRVLTHNVTFGAGTTTEVSGAGQRVTESSE